MYQCQSLFTFTKKAEISHGYHESIQFTHTFVNTRTHIFEIFRKIYFYSRKRGKENTIARDYVLPDYTHIKRGYVRPIEETTGRSKDGEQASTLIITHLCMIS